MKKKVKILVLAVLSGMIAVSNWVGNRQSVEMNALMLENVEALAAGENNSNIWCFGTGSVDCPRGHNKVAYVRYFYSLFD